MATNNRRLRRDDGCCSVNFLKYIAFIFNFLFYLAGVAVLAMGVWTIGWKFDYTVLLPTQTYKITTYILIGTGLLVLLVGILGCLGVLRESRCSLLSFTFLLLIVFLLEAVVGVLAYVYSEQIGTELRNSLNGTIVNGYGVDPTVSSALKTLHLQKQCCGAENFEDWRASVWFASMNEEAHLKERGFPLLTPDFCCRTISEKCGKRDHPSNIYYDGCVTALEDEIRRQSIIIGAVALGLSLVQIFGVFISCCLYIKLKDVNDEVDEDRKNGYYQ
uniref:Tetraspanin n=1 Tax=Plectus sambesii TaxID=2011161 RepID=A0A914XBU8_9BILA